MRRSALALAVALTMPLLAALLGMPAAAAGLPDAMPGWSITRSGHDFATLTARVEAAIERSPLRLVFKASPNPGAEKLGTPITQNAVFGVYAPQFAVRNIQADVASGIEAPLRLYVVADDGGTASIGYKTAASVFAPYAGGGLAELAAELDAILAAIVAEATAP